MFIATGYTHSANVILVTLVYVTVMIPMIAVISYIFLQVIQTPTRKPRKVVWSLEDHHDLRNKASMVLLPFPENTQQSKEIDSDNVYKE